MLIFYYFDLYPLFEFIISIAIRQVDTRRRFNVYRTSMQRRKRRMGLLWALKRRRVSTGYVISTTIHRFPS